MSRKASEGLRSELGVFQKLLKVHNERCKVRNRVGGRNQYGDTGRSEDIMNLEPSTVRILLGKEDPLVLEIGAHVGTDTRQFLDAFRNIKLYCFEPDPRCIKKHRRLIHDKRCTLIESAISNNDGKAVLSVSSGWPPGHPRPTIQVGKSVTLLGVTLSFYLRIPTKGDWNASSSIKKAVSHSIKHPWLDFSQTVEVRTRTLDSWTKEMGISYVDFIWSDVQGAERDMIEGAVNTLRETGMVYMEYGETSTYPDALTRDATVGLMEKHGFRLIPDYSSPSHDSAGNLLFKNKNLK